MVQGLRFRLWYAMMYILSKRGSITQGTNTMADTTKKLIKANFVALTGQQPEKPYRADTARDLYYKDLVALVGDKEVALTELHKRWQENPPKLPKSRKVEPPAGWVAFFCRVGVCKIVQRSIPAK